MKKLLLICFLVYSSLLFAQPQIKSIEEFHAFKWYNNSGYNLVSNCYNNTTVQLKLAQTIDTTKDYTFGDTYYEIKFLLYDDNGNLKSTSSPDKIINRPNGTIDIYAYIDLNQISEYYHTIVTIQSYHLAGYPNLMSYVPIGSLYTSLNSKYDIKNIRCYFDDDNDGIPDGCDNSDGNAKPDLYVSGLTVKVDKKTYDVYGKGETPEFVFDKEHTFKIKIKNNDDGAASSFTYWALVSTDKKYPNHNGIQVYNYKTRNMSAMEGKTEKEDSFSEYITGFMGTLNLVDGNTYYMFIHVDPKDRIDESESGEKNNIYYFPFKYKIPKTGKITLNLNNGISYVDYERIENTNNTLKVISLYNGSTIYQKTLYSASETVYIPSYYTQSSDLFAIYVNNKYIKKISIGDEENYKVPVPVER